MVEIDDTDVQTIMDAATTLDVLNRKYGFPYGKTPGGIVIAALEQAKAGSS